MNKHRQPRITPRAGGRPEVGDRIVVVGDAQGGRLKANCHKYATKYQRSCRVLMESGQRVPSGREFRGVITKVENRIHYLVLFMRVYY